MAEILHPFLTKFRQILRGNIDQYFFEKDCFRSSFTPTIRHFETGLFKKSGKSGSARPPRGMKLSNKRSLSERLNCLSLNHKRNSYFSRFCGVSRPFEVLGQVNGAKRNDHKWQITPIIRMIWRHRKWKRSPRCSSIRSLLCLVWYFFLPPKNTLSNTWYKYGVNNNNWFWKAIGLFQKYHNTLCYLSKIWRDSPSPHSIAPRVIFGGTTKS